MYAYKEKLENFMGQCHGTAYVYDSDAVMTRCNHIAHLLSGVEHYFDIRHMPNLSILYLIRRYLGCKMIVPSAEWLSYVSTIGIQGTDVCVLNNHHCCWAETADAFYDMGAHHDTELLLVPYECISSIVSSAAAEGFLAHARLKVIIDAGAVTTAILENDLDKIRRIEQMLKTPLGVMHGADVISDICTLWLEVRTTKEIGGVTYVILSGGANILWDITKNGNAARKKYKISSAAPDDESHVESVTFCGPLCTPQDALAIDSTAREILPGELVVIENIGSEFYHKSPVYFISHPIPAEFLLIGNELYPVRMDHAPS